jgi:uncharacterized membrane protein
MIELSNSIEIQKPVEEVFSFLLNLENLSKWNYFVLRVKKLSKGPITKGTTFHQTRKTDEQTLEIIDLEHNTRIEVSTVSSVYPRLNMRFDLSQTKNGTRILDNWKLDTGRPAFLENIAAGNIKAAVHQNLTKLKTLLEMGSVTLQDGRISTI